ncbi:appr-1-p processing enzyme family domain-containing protein [Candidatus Epulonipiscium fishelsonii]|uniref:Appr-1-p processing enzyme family domain-containing protein n=1 Tax=Candidatus Epulonipiscium fishelsonii TaxID=77094 RepID=A0ACC8XBL0_9FIRM|nr:appr-1-p processing enzyme family domain-containing protein [Epulopiscium sp. SCG-B11WGA-EpuloA1]ONI41380.1 appr-1-p processing enzyme family domain-containing protein [Epulopiscium sp. SCG-B05WGA-EpuloA1]ONI47298.1 appr-1-p processing enzyme family domain-containing protein [Epulopiscium sp. SCG-C06WGA-EpuloA1]
MEQLERLNYLITYLAEEYEDFKLPKEYDEKRYVLRGFMNVREPKEIDKTWLKIQDAFLQEELNAKGIINVDLLEPIPSDPNIILWQGDITRLKVDAIVNAANSKMLGCFISNHRCIDNAIHSAAGFQLRLACKEIMQKQSHDEKTGTAKITEGFNLPSKYVIHTVGPIVDGQLTELHKEQLKSCYLSCLKLAQENDCKSIAFCCISTGEFMFPQEDAAKIAIDVVKEYLKSSKIKVVFNVFKDSDYDIYKNLLEQ